MNETIPAIIFFIIKNSYAFLWKQFWYGIHSGDYVRFTHNNFSARKKLIINKSGNWEEGIWQIYDAIYPTPNELSNNYYA